MTPYPKRKDTPMRMTRKQARRKVFTENKTAAKKLRKARRLLRLQTSQEGEQ